MNQTNQQYVYHSVPPHMKGTILLPLNELKHSHPHIYENQVKKYVGRKRILERTIPLMNCLWNDVLHTTAIDPHVIYSKLKEAGFNYPLRKFYKIPVEHLDMNRTCVMFQTNGDPNTFVKSYEMFDPARFNLYSEFVSETSDYYKDMNAQGKHPLVHHLLPHVLYKGTIDTTGLEIIEA